MPSSSPADPNLISVDNPILGMIDAEAARQGVDRNLAHVVAQMESGYDPGAVSPKGARGVFQLMPDTAKDVGVADPMNPAQNIRGGIRYLAKLGEKYGRDDTVRILAGYNAGPGNVDKYGGVPPFPETANYVQKGARLLASASPPTAAAPPDLAADPNLTLVETAPSASAPQPQPSVQILPPLSEPPGPPAPEEKSVKGFLDNLTTSAYNNLLSPIVHPGQTLAGISNLLEGMGEMTGNKPVPGMHGRQAIEGLTDLYTQRYGSWQGFKDAWYKDPVGMVGDLAIAADGLGLGKAAVQDFIRASGLTDAATAARDTLAGVVPDMGKPGAAVTAGVKAVPGAAVGAFKKAFDPALILSGPHSMVIGAKLEFAKQVAKAAREAWKGAGEAPEVAEAAAEAAPAVKLTPDEQAFWKQFATPPAGPVTPPDLAAQQAELAAQASMSPRVMLRSEAAQVFPEAYGQPAAESQAASAAPLLTPQDLTELTTGRPPSRQSATAQQAAAETLATAQAAAPPAAPSTTGLAEAGGEMGAAITGHMYDALWQKVLAGDITEGGQPSAVLQAARIVRNNGGLRTPESFRAFVADYTQVPRGPQFQAAMRDLVARHSPAAPPAAPIAPEAAPAAPAVPPVAEAPTGPVAAKPQAAEIARRLENEMRAGLLTDYLKANRVPRSMVDQFGDKQWDLLARGAGTGPPTPEQIAEIKQNLGAYEQAANLPPEVAQMPTAQAEAALAPALKSVARTAPEARIEAFAQHFASDPEITPEDVRAIQSSPEDVRRLEELGRALKIKGAPAPGEIAKIADRVAELRGGEPPAAPARATPITPKEPPGSAPVIDRARANIAKLPEDATARNVFIESDPYAFQNLQRNLDDLDSRAHTMTKNDWWDETYFDSPNTLMRWGPETQRPLTRQEARILNQAGFADVAPGDLPTRAQADRLNGFYRGNVKTPGIWRDMRNAEHRQLVAKALAEGKQVPPEVLAEYPELQQPPPASKRKGRTR